MNSKISSIVLAALMGVTVLICAFFYLGDTEAFTTTAGEMDAPSNTSLMINWAYILIGFAAFATAALAILTFVSKLSYNWKSVMVPMITFVALGSLLLITYFGADTTPMNIVGYEGSHEPGIYQITNMCLVSAVVLAAIATFVTLFGWVAKRF